LVLYFPVMGVVEVNLTDSLRCVELVLESNGPKHDHRGFGH
jgi:hypothetical protein